MPKPNKQVQIDFIISCLKKGEDRALILSKFGKKWQMSDRSFDRILKQAKKEYSLQQLKIKAAKDELDLQNGVQQHKKLIADVNERKEVLTKILRGEIALTKPMVIEGVIELIPVVPDWMDRKNAIAELNKMEGEYADIAFKLKGDKDNPLNPTPLLTEDQFQKLLNAARKSKTSSGK